MAVEQFEKSNGDGTAPVRPKAHLDSAQTVPGLAWFLLRVLQLQIQKTTHTCYYWWRYRRSGTGCSLFTPRNSYLYERDSGFEAVSGLWPHFATRVKQLRIGYFLIKEGVISTRHLVHTTDGKWSEWGMRKDATEVKSLPSAPMCISHGSLCA
jgi:hypothetical protein